MMAVRWTTGKHVTDLKEIVMAHVVIYMPFKNPEDKKRYQRDYMIGWMRRKRAKAPPAVIREVLEFREESDTNVGRLWFANRSPGSYGYPDSAWDDDLLDQLKAG